MARITAIKIFFSEFTKRWRAFRGAERGNVAMIFTLALIPLMTGVGAAIDYSRANAVKSSMQAALDAALLAGAKDGSSSWTNIASNSFNAILAPKTLSSLTSSFVSTETASYSGNATASVPTSTLGIVRINSLLVTASATAMAAEADNSCILTLDHGQPTSHVSLTLNGAPVINLSDCSIRSNTSLGCNGHDGNVTKSYAAGSATACGKPKSGAAVVPDTYVDLANNITSVCAGSRPGVTWQPGVLPLGAGFKTVSQPGYTEYHICGDLTLSGNGYLTGSSPASDVVIVIENGSLIVDDHSSINTAKTAIVMTGNNSWPAQVSFPNGNGKSASLSLSPPTSVGNPWQGVALYLDPKLTKNVDNSWGPVPTLMPTD